MTQRACLPVVLCLSHRLVLCRACDIPLNALKKRKNKPKPGKLAIINLQVCLQDSGPNSPRETLVVPGPGPPPSLEFLGREHRLILAPGRICLPTADRTGHAARQEGRARRPRQVR